MGCVLRGRAGGGVCVEGWGGVGGEGEWLKLGQDQTSRLTPVGLPQPAPQSFMLAGFMGTRARALSRRN